MTRKSKIAFWIIIGIVIGTTTASVSQNILAGLFIGAGAGILLMIVTNLETDKKI